MSSKGHKGPSKLNPFKSAGAFDLVTFTIGAKSGTTINVGLQLLTDEGQTLDASNGPVGFHAWLSDNTDGSTITATTASGGVAIGTNGLALPIVASKDFNLVSNQAGLIDLNIIQSSTHNFYLAVQLPTGRIVVSSVIAF